MGIGLDLVANNRISTLIQQAILLKRITKERKNRKEVFFFFSQCKGRIRVRYCQHSHWPKQCKREETSQAM
jgi:hypothetical protein